MNAVILICGCCGQSYNSDDVCPWGELVDGCLKEECEC